MNKTRKDITILAVGDRADYDTFKKFHKERDLFLKHGFDYINLDYKCFLNGSIPSIKTKKVIIFLFFPFSYWNRYIEHGNYKGIYGNASFFRKFSRFWDRTNKIIRENLPDKEIFFINNPRLCGLYRDKSAVLRKLSGNGVLVPKLHKISTIREVRNLLNEGHRLFLKPRYGSMGKGITFLDWSNWQTNFIFRNNKIISRKSDGGWRFRSVTGNNAFLRALLKKNVMIEDAVDSLILRKMKVDLRIYTFFNKVVYVYPRKNRFDRITTNITQGGKGDPGLLEVLPKHLVDKAKKAAVKTSKMLGLNLLGMDVMLDRNLKDVYVVDVNLFPGFPKRRTFNLTHHIISELVKADNKKEFRYEKGSDI